jgi:MtaA/CmuA family methyltransferase
VTDSCMTRFQDALRGRPNDRVPIIPMIGGWAAVNFSDVPFSKHARDSKRIVDAQVRAMETVGHDAFFAYADPLYIPEAFGCTVRYTDTGPLVDALPHTIASAEDLEKTPIPDARRTGRLPVILEVVKELHGYGSGDIPVLGAFEGAFTSTTRVLEAEHVMRMIYKNPVLLESLLDRVNGFLLEFGRALIENGANVLFIPEPSASASMISPPMFRRFVLPRLRSLASELNVPCILHICGDTSPTLQDMQETGFHLLSLDQCMDLSKSRDLVPEAVLGGNVDPIKSLLMGTREQVVGDTLNCLRTGGINRFILMSGCGVPPGTSIENLRAMVKTAIDYGLGT